MTVRIDSEQELARRSAAINKALDTIELEWRGLRRLSEKERRNHPGIVAQMLARPFETVFEIVAAAQKAARAKEKGNHPPDEHAEAQKKLAAAFNSTLGDQDHGIDPETFEADRLLLAQRTVNHQAQIAERLSNLARLFGDDALHTGAAIAEVGQPALDVTRTLAASNPAFRALLAPALDALREMTRAARAARAKAESPAASEDPTPEGK